MYNEENPLFLIFKKRRIQKIFVKFIINLIKILNF